jgi:transposase-like protein
LIEIEKSCAMALAGSIWDAYLCPDCGSDQLKRNGFTTGGKQKYKCKACGRYGSLNPQQSYSQEVRDQVLNAYLERPSIRGLERTFGINRLTITSWIKKSQKSAQPE